MLLPTSANQAAINAYGGDGGNGGNGMTGAKGANGGNGAEGWCSGKDLKAESLWPSKVQGFFTVQGFHRVFS